MSVYNQTRTAPEWRGLDKNNYWFDSIPFHRREHWRDGKLVEWFPESMILSPEQFPMLPKYMTAEFKTYTAPPPLVVTGEYIDIPVNGLPLTFAVNKLTVDPTPPPNQGADMATLELNPLPAGVAPPAAPEAKPESPVLAAVRKLIEADADMATLTKTYMAIRSKKEDLDAQAKEKLDPLKTSLVMLENHFLAKFNALGVDNVKTEFGTPYVSTKTSATVADGDAYFRFVLAQSLNGLSLPPATVEKLVNGMLNSGALAFFESRAAKGPVETYVTQHQAPPPGVNWSATRSINVRK